MGLSLIWQSYFYFAQLVSNGQGKCLLYICGILKLKEGEWEKVMLQKIEDKLDKVLYEIELLKSEIDYINRAIINDNNNKELLSLYGEREY